MCGTARTRQGIKQEPVRASSKNPRGRQADGDKMASRRTPTRRTARTREGIKLTRTRSTRRTPACVNVLEVARFRVQEPANLG